jgi:hypothetical protein
LHPSLLTRSPLSLGGRSTRWSAEFRVAALVISAHREPRKILLGLVHSWLPADRREHDEQEAGMAVARVTEISSTSTTSFEDAIKSGLERANATLRNVKSAWIKEQTVRVEGGSISEYQVNMLVTFVLDD